MTLRNQIEQNILRAASEMDKAEHAVAQLLIAFHRRPITQNEIALSQPFLGAHPKWEESMPDHGTTTRKVRAVINSLRVKHNIAILASDKGYWLANTTEEAEEYLDRMEEQARASAKSYMVTFHAMSKAIDGLRERDTRGLFDFEDEVVVEAPRGQLSGIIIPPPLS